MVRYNVPLNKVSARIVIHLETEAELKLLNHKDLREWFLIKAFSLVFIQSNKFSLQEVTNVLEIRNVIILNILNMPSTKIGWVCTWKPSKMSPKLLMLQQNDTISHDIKTFSVTQDILHDVVSSCCYKNGERCIISETTVPYSMLSSGLNLNNLILNSCTKQIVHT